MNSFFRIYAIASKEFRQLRRDRLTFGMIAGIPIALLLLFGYAINQDIRHLSAGVVDQANTSLSRALIQVAEATQVVDIKYHVNTSQELEALMRRGQISVGIFIPHDFERRVALGRRPPAQLLVDAGDPVILGSAEGLLFIPIDTHSVPRSAFERLPATFELRAFYNPERRTAVQIVPGIIGIILTMTMVLFTGVAIVRERERGNLEFLITTPVKPMELMAGKIIPYILIGLFQVTLVLALGSWLFRVPILGDISDVYIGALCFISASLALGLLISTFAQNQFQTFQMTFFVMMPSILLSGFMFPYEGMPTWAQYFSELIPMTHFVRVIRAIMLRGASLGDVIGDITALIIIFAVAFMIAVLRFRKRLD